MADATAAVCNLGILDALSGDAVQEILESYAGFSAATESLLSGVGDLSVGSELARDVHRLCKRQLHSLVREHFLGSLEVSTFLS